MSRTANMLNKVQWNPARDDDPYFRTIRPEPSHEPAHARARPATIAEVTERLTAAGFVEAEK